MSGDLQTRQRRKEKKKQKRGMTFHLSDKKIICKFKGKIYFYENLYLRALSSINNKFALFFTEKERNY